MATSDDYVRDVWERVSKGKPQPVAGVWRVAIQSTLPAALNRLADRVAADDSLYPLLMHDWEVQLGTGGVAGQAILVGPDRPEAPDGPIILLSAGARKRIRIQGRLEDLVNYPDDITPLYKYFYLPNFHDLENPPPIQDDRIRYYTFWNQSLVVRTIQSQLPIPTLVHLLGCKVPAITDDVFEADGELFDNLVDIGCALIMESASISEVVRQAEMASGEVPATAGTAA